MRTPLPPRLFLVREERDAKGGIYFVFPTHDPLHDLHGLAARATDLISLLPCRVPPNIFQRIPVKKRPGFETRAYAVVSGRKFPIFIKTLNACAPANRSISRDMKGYQVFLLLPQRGESAGVRGDDFQPLTQNLSPFQGRGDFIAYAEGYLQFGK